MSKYKTFPLFGEIADLVPKQWVPKQWVPATLKLTRSYEASAWRLHENEKHYDVAVDPVECDTQRKAAAAAEALAANLNLKGGRGE